MTVRRRWNIHASKIMTFSYLFFARFPLRTICANASFYQPSDPIILKENNKVNINNKNLVPSCYIAKDGQDGDVKYILNR